MNICVDCFERTEVKHSGYYSFTPPTPNLAQRRRHFAHCDFSSSSVNLIPTRRDAASPRSGDGRPRRLINAHSLRLVDFCEDEAIPSYAILSHRWVEGEEVTFDEFRNPKEATKRKQGYTKIREACAEACDYGLDYIWIDTCCINKGDQGEVARNIKSMYAYYENAYICFAYLADVEGYEDFELSSWFRRGWTLQELLAPRTVMFFTRGWILMGCKHGSRSAAISRATSISEDVLQGKRSIVDVDFLEKMSWTMGRKTTKPPDQAYCLLGMLGVSMEPDYNETVMKAFRRLQKILVKSNPRYAKTFSRYINLYMMVKIEPVRLSILAWMRKTGRWIAKMSFYLISITICIIPMIGFWTVRCIWRQI
ncbi:hypothetical protein VKT23_011874 [Stygiomarasmius scandens]|uniref:Heterokaryon incompatibility domain-containing protein n=1 Tax=Marasmiellus scandens TaxID=2682957 RepID=A0ABR1J7Z8_9AGAR